jgi:hypothetical protein
MYNGKAAHGFSFGSPLSEECAYERDAFLYQVGAVPAGGYSFSSLKVGAEVLRLATLEALREGTVMHCAGCARLVVASQPPCARCKTEASAGRRVLMYTRERPRGTFEATVWRDGHNVYVGMFCVEEEAAAAADAYIRSEGLSRTLNWESVEKAAVAITLAREKAVVRAARLTVPSRAAQARACVGLTSVCTYAHARLAFPLRAGGRQGAAAYLQEACGKGVHMCFFHLHCHQESSLPPFSLMHLFSRRAPLRRLQAASAHAPVPVQRRMLAPAQRMAEGCLWMWHQPR